LYENFPLQPPNKKIYLSYRGTNVWPSLAAGTSPFPAIFYHNLVVKLNAYMSPKVISPFDPPNIYMLFFTTALE